MIRKCRFLKMQRQLTSQCKLNITKASVTSFAVFSAIFVLGYLPKQSFAFSAYSIMTNVIQNNPYSLNSGLAAMQDTNLVLVQQVSSFFSVENISGKPGDTLPIKISLSPEITNSEQQIPKSAYATLRGIPEDFKLSSGLKTKKTWVVSLGDLQHLSLISISNYTGSFSFDITIHLGESAPQTQTIAVNISDIVADIGDAGVNKDLAQTGSSQSSEPEQTAAIPRLNEAEETHLLQRANQLLKDGNIAAARMIYEDLASRGSASAAFSMGRSFDPESFKTIIVVGLKPDIEQARKWYEMAQKLGSNGAAERLTALNAVK